MSTIVTRAGKGSPLTNAELDANFSNLNTDKLESGGALGTPASGTLTNCTGLPVAGLSYTAATWTYTGPADPIGTIVLDSPKPIQIGSTVETVTGVFAQSVIFKENTVEAISFTNLQGIQNFATPRLNVLVTLSFPVLTSVSGSIAIGLSARENRNVTTVNAPALIAIGESFTAQSMPSLSALSLPSLQTVGNDFNVSSMSALTSISCPVLKSVMGVLTCTANVTTFDMPSLTTVGNFTFSSNAITTLNLPALNTAIRFEPNFCTALNTISLPALTICYGFFNPNNLAALTTLSLPTLTRTAGFSCTALTALTTLSAPLLTAIDLGVFSSLGPSNMPALTTFNFPVLTTVGGSVGISNMASLTTLSLPALSTIGVFLAISTMSALTTISIPALTMISNQTGSANVISLTSGTAALTTFELPSTLLRVGATAGNVTITSAALTQTSVDSILVRLAALDGTGGTTTFNNRVVTITGTSSTPSATGLAAKATLVARGCTVTHN